MVLAVYGFSTLRYRLEHSLPALVALTEGKRKRRYASVRLTFLLQQWAEGLPQGKVAVLF